MVTVTSKYISSNLKSNKFSANVEPICFPAFRWLLGIFHLLHLGLRTGDERTQRGGYQCRDETWKVNLGTSC